VDLNCPTCGYDLRHLQQCRCPECGTPFVPGQLSREIEHMRRSASRLAFWSGAVPAVVIVITSAEFLLLRAGVWVMYLVILMTVAGGLFACAVASSLLSRAWARFILLRVSGRLVDSPGWLVVVACGVALVVCQSALILVFVAWVGRFVGVP